MSLEPGLLERYIDRILLGALATLRRSLRPSLSLASAEASYVNGTEILVDGRVLVEPGMKIALNGQHAVICPAYQ